MHFTFTMLVVLSLARCWDLNGALQVLKRGGAFHCLEFSQMAVPGLREVYNAYSFNVIPQIGRWAHASGITGSSATSTCHAAHGNDEP